MRDHHENFQGKAAEVDQTVRFPVHTARTLRRILFFCLLLFTIGLVDAAVPTLWQEIANQLSTLSAQQ